MDGLTGLVVEAGSSSALREAMDQLHQNRGRAEQMGQNARARYEQLFTGRLMGLRYAQLYSQIIAEAS